MFSVPALPVPIATLPPTLVPAPSVIVPPTVVTFPITPAPLVAAVMSTTAAPASLMFSNELTAIPPAVNVPAVVALNAL